MGLQKVGDWNKVTALIGHLAQEMEKARQISLKRWGLKAEGIAKSHISNQDLGWVELNAEYLARKIRKGQSENILVASSSYFQSITSYVQNNVSFAGVKKEKLYADGTEVANIAAYHEFGGGNLPARPLWQPTFKETMEWYRKSDSTPAKIFLKNIKRYL